MSLCTRFRASLEDMPGRGRAGWWVCSHQALLHSLSPTSVAQDGFSRWLSTLTSHSVPDALAVGPFIFNPQRSFHHMTAPPPFGQRSPGTAQLCCLSQPGFRTPSAGAAVHGVWMAPTDAPPQLPNAKATTWCFKSQHIFIKSSLYAMHEDSNVYLQSLNITRFPCID